MFLDGKNVIFAFSSEMEPICRVHAGTTLKVQTHDCFYQQMLDEGSSLGTFNMNDANPATGPIYVEEAEVGDLLKVSIEDIEVADKGVAMVIPGTGLLAEKNTEETKIIIPIHDGKARLFGMELPIMPDRRDRKLWKRRILPHEYALESRRQYGHQGDHGRNDPVLSRQAKGSSFRSRRLSCPHGRWRSRRDRS